jgi:hypothetical protein
MVNSSASAEAFYISHVLAHVLAKGRGGLVGAWTRSEALRQEMLKTFVGAHLGVGRNRALAVLRSAEMGAHRGQGLYLIAVGRGLSLSKLGNSVALLGTREKVHLDVGSAGSLVFASVVIALGVQLLKLVVGARSRILENSEN